MAAVCAGVLSAQGAVPADELRQNYQSIIERNPFGLKPIPVPEAPKPPPEKEPEVDYFLTGITSVGHPVIPRQAYIMTREKGQKEPNYYALPEWSQKEIEIDGIKVVSIDPKSGEVKVETPHGAMQLSFKTHGVEPPAAPVAGVPGAMAMARPGQPGAVPPPPGSPANAYNRTVAGRGGATITTPENRYSRGGPIPSRTVRTRSANTPTISTPGVNSPPPMNTGAPQQDAPEPIDPVQQYLMMRAQEEAARMEGQPFPPTPPIP